MCDGIARRDRSHMDYRTCCDHQRGLDCRIDSCLVFAARIYIGLDKTRQPIFKQYCHKPRFAKPVVVQTIVVLSAVVATSRTEEHQLMSLMTGWVIALLPLTSNATLTLFLMSGS